MSDLISRQAAIDAIHEDADWLAAQGSDWQVERMERDKSILKSLPSAQPQRKKGEWIDKSGGIDDAWNYCSVCGEQAIDLYDYCPNCGADMREGDAE